MVTTILSYGASFITMNPKKENVLFWAAKNNQLDIIKYYKKQGGDINAKNGQGHGGN
jgi:hypothetical protein